jgi:hypothetical protein
MRALLALALLLLTAWPAHADRLFTTGFEENNAGSATMWNSFACTQNTTAPHSGTYRASCSGQAVTKALSTNKTSGALYTRFYFNSSVATPAADRIVMVWEGNGGTDNVRVTLLTTGKLRLTNVTTGATADTAGSISVDTWYRLEVRALISNTVGELELRWYLADATTEIETALTIGAANIDTIGADGNYSQLLLQEPAGANTFRFDDIAINDNGGTFQNSWPGPGKIYLLKPDGDVSVTWTPTCGANNANVDDVPGTPDDATTEVTTGTANNVDRLTLTALGAEVTSDATIKLANVYGRVDGDGTAGTRQMRFKIWDEGGTLTNGPTNNLCNSTSYARAGTSDHLVLDTSGKTKTNLDSFDVGYENLNTANCFVTAVWVNVEWLETVAATNPPNGLGLMGAGK